MSESEVVKVLAERDGCAERWVIMKRGLYYRPNAKGYTYNASEAWVVSEAEANKHVYPHDEPVTKHLAPLPDYLHSRDALAPVMAKLTPEERSALLHSLLTQLSEEDDSTDAWLYWRLLTLPPEQLARAVAEAVVVCGKQKGGGK